MIVVMQKGATPAQVEHMAQRVEELGLKSHVIVGAERTVIAAIGEKRDYMREALESGPGVEEGRADPGPVQGCQPRSQTRTDPGRAPGVCGSARASSASSPGRVRWRTRSRSSARPARVKAVGATGLRGGAFKPRTSPYSFQGLKEKGLQLLAKARAETGLAIVTEVVSPEDVPLVAEYADVLQIGARNMQNYRLLEAAGLSPRAVLLKRGPSATMEELLLAAEYILDAGNQNVILCERGIRTFEAHTRFTLPLATVPYLHSQTHLPVVVDPSHGTGHTYLVPDMAAASVACGADGLIIEVHPDPEHAMSDGYQTLNFEQFAETMDRCRKIAVALGSQM